MSCILHTELIPLCSKLLNHCETVAQWRLVKPQISKSRLYYMVHSYWVKKRDINILKCLIHADRLCSSVHSKQLLVLWPPKLGTVFNTLPLSDSIMSLFSHLGQGYQALCQFECKRALQVLPICMECCNALYIIIIIRFDSNNSFKLLLNLCRAKTHKSVSNLATLDVIKTSLPSAV